MAVIVLFALIAWFLMEDQRKKQDARQQVIKQEEERRLEREKERARTAQLMRFMKQGQQALERKDFPEAKSCFERVLDLNPPDEPITEWSHDQHVQQQPTRRDAWLGLGLAAMGVGDVQCAEDYIRQSRYYLISPDNLGERKRLQRRGKLLKAYLESSQWRQRKAQLSSLASFERALTLLDASEIDRLSELGDQSLLKLINSKIEELDGRSYQPPWPRVKQLAEEDFEFYWHVERHFAHAGDGHECMVTSCHLTWIEPAAISLLQQTQKWAGEGDQSRVQRAFALLDGIYGLGRTMLSRDCEPLRVFAWSFADNAQWKLAIYFMGKYVRYEPPYLWPAGLEDMPHWAYLAIKQGDFISAESILEAILAFPRNYESGITEEDFEKWESMKRDRVCRLYEWMAADASQRKRYELVQRYQQRVFSLQ
jgi:tetratricopeptide (TPR) repeat protein